MTSNMELLTCSSEDMLRLDMWRITIPDSQHWRSPHPDVYNASTVLTRRILFRPQPPGTPIPIPSSPEDTWDNSLLLRFLLHLWSLLSSGLPTRRTSIT